MEPYLQCVADQIHASHFRTVSTDGAPHTVYSPQQRSLSDLYTDTVRRQLADLCTAHHTLLEDTIGAHLWCFAYWIRDSRFHTF